MKGFTAIELTIELTIVIFIVVLVVMLPLAYIGERNRHEAFLVDCMRAGEKAYECEYKWKQMHPDPVVVYAPFNR